ncbi:protein translocase subunit SecF [Thalassiella azotivora]
MFSFAQFGNDLYTGRRSFDFVRRWKVYTGIGAALIAVSIGLILTLGLNPGIEFRGGSEFRVTDTENPDVGLGEEVVRSAYPDAEPPRASVIGGSSVRIQTERLDDEQTDELRSQLAEAYDVPESSVTSSFVGPSWGQDVTRQAVTGLVIFLALVAAVITLYFRTWAMAVAALYALAHDLVISAGIYALTGFEVTPGTVIGFLTILGYSLYDTVVVFDKVRENTEHVMASTKRTFAEAVNLAVNQTLVRSINTSVVAVLPVASVLFIGAFLLGAGTLRDISLSLFVGTLVGTLSSIFIAPAVYVLLRGRQPEVRQQAERVEQARRKSPVPAGAVGASGPVGSVLTAERDEDVAEDDTEDGEAARVGSRRPVSGGARGQRQQPRRNRSRRR